MSSSVSPVQKEVSTSVDGEDSGCIVDRVVLSLEPNRVLINRATCCVRWYQSGFLPVDG